MKIRFPKTIRMQLMAAAAGITLIISLMTLTIYFSLFQSFLRKNQIQSSEFNLQLVTSHVSSSMADIIYFSKWTCSNSEILNYLERMETVSGPAPSSDADSENLRLLALNSFERFKEEYQNTLPNEYITHALISTNSRKQFLHILGPSESSRAKAAEIIYLAPYFDTLLQAPDFKWIGLQDDLFVRVNPPKVLPIIRPVYNEFNSDIIGWSYLSISEELLTDYLSSYPLGNDGILFFTMGDLTYYLKDGKFEIAKDFYSPLKDLTSYALNDTTQVDSVKMSDGSKRIMITIPVDGVRGWSFSQILSEQQFAQQRNFYYILIAGVCLIIFCLGILLMVLLNRIINVPVKAIREKIDAVSHGDFSREPAIEWDHELGDIGKGINSLSTSIVMLMDKRIEDEKHKKDLEYQILQSQINPHFLYNTLNSIKWMATIQGANGIAEMTTALARLMKNVSKGTSVPIPLKEELDLVKDYFLILQYRYGGSISLECSVASDDLYACLIHRFTLQPIIENSLFHGIEPKGQAGKITVTAVSKDTASGKILQICVTDNGIGMSSETIEKVLSGKDSASTDFFRHVGINNVNQRIKYAYGDRYGISITSEVGVYTAITITIPYELSETGGDYDKTFNSR
ncbi:MAG: sensor histidine kinase [Lachnospiraceae bacterium]